MKKVFKGSGRFIALALALLLGLSAAFPASAQTGPAPAEAAVTVESASFAGGETVNSVHSEARIKLNYASIKLEQGEKIKLKLLNAGDKPIKWSSDKPKVVRVTQKGWVTALKAGKTARITAKYVGKEYKCIVRVTKGSGDNKEDKKVNTEYIKLSANRDWGKYKKLLEYNANDKESLFVALVNGFERGAETVRVYIPKGQGEAYVNHYTNGVRDDLFELLLAQDRVLSGYANDFNMNWTYDYVDFVPVYKHTWKCILSMRYKDYKISNVEKKMIKKLKKMVEKATADTDDPQEIISNLYDAVANLGTYRYSYTPGSREYSEYDAASLLFDGSGVCEAYASVFQILCEILGYDNVMVAGFANGDKHAWNKIKVGKGWYSFDLTWDDHDYDTGASRDYFMLKDDDPMLIAEHIWSSYYYPASP
ncbi:MAG: Ig-like domain-containing protein [Lachnospiraceae bacterium]|nr:Ig-like domain-containing protein [Lachnospiraceae bacterium]